MLHRCVTDKLLNMLLLAAKIAHLLLSVTVLLMITMLYQACHARWE